MNPMRCTHQLLLCGKLRWAKISSAHFPVPVGFEFSYCKHRKFLSALRSSGFHHGNLDQVRWCHVQGKVGEDISRDKDVEHGQQALASLKAAVKTQGEKVEQLQASQAPEAEVRKASTNLRALLKELEELSLKLEPQSTFDRQRMHLLAAGRLYFSTAFELYGGAAGLYDFGPLGVGLLEGLVEEWHRHFVLQDAMLKVACPLLTPEAVLRASGHVQKFADYVVKDVVTGECYRLDHLIKLHLEKKVADKKTPEEEKKKISSVLARLDGLDVESMEALMKEYSVKAPVTGNDVTEPEEFNLMFPVSVGAADQRRFYLRPETSQGIFLNFQKLLQFTHQKLPLVAAQVGPAFRNELCPQSKLLRLRQFTMAEIVHFCDPHDKSHHKFSEVSSERIKLYSRDHQLSGRDAAEMSVAEAVGLGLVANETLGYYMARIQQYLLKVGVVASKLRFRQHLHNEMAHYACDCWDAECLTSYGWIECVGCADRSAYDLSCHTSATGVRLTVERPLPQPKTVETTVPVLDKGRIKSTFKKNAKVVVAAIDNLSEDQILVLKQTLQTEGEYRIPFTDYTIGSTHVLSFNTESRTALTEHITPAVLEPSFGLERILYVLLEHTFQVRKDTKRTFFSLPPRIAPLKVSIITLSQRHKQEAAPYVTQIVSGLLEREIPHTVDDSTGSIGRRYARTDEASVPFAVTVDFDTLNDSPASVTLRERDSTEQVRLPVTEVAETVELLTKGRLQWDDVTEKYPKFLQQNSPSDHSVH